MNVSAKDQDDGKELPRVYKPRLIFILFYFLWKYVHDMTVMSSASNELIYYDFYLFIYI